MREIMTCLGFIDDKLYEFESYAEFEKCLAETPHNSCHYFTPIGLHEQLHKLTEMELMEMESEDDATTGERR